MIMMTMMIIMMMMMMMMMKITMTVLVIGLLLMRTDWNCVHFISITVYSVNFF